MISVIIPAYKNPKYLDMCLKSIIENQEEKNEIIVVLDGYVELSKDVVEKYKDDISVLEFPENRGMSTAINYGVYNATGDWILIANEDNVFCKNWDRVLSNYTLTKNNIQNKYSLVVSINQVEPVGPSMYNFVIKDYGKIVEEFQYDKFIEDESLLSRDGMIKKFNPLDTPDGSTFPFMMMKTDFLRVGGFDIDYPSPFVVDWDFFLKCELSGMEIVKLSSLAFYHFGGKSIKNRNGYIGTTNELVSFYEGEQKASEYFEYKWGFKPKRDGNNKCLPYINF